MAVGSKIKHRLRARLGLRSSGRRTTAEEFDSLPEDAFGPHLRFELIQGVLVVTPPPGNGEVAPNEELGHLVWYHKHSHPQGSLVDVVLSEQTIFATPNRRRADRAIWSGLGRVPDVRIDVPAIVVEFVSASKRDQVRDYEEKRSEYLSAGVLEYWIIDRFRRTMTVHRNSPGPVATLVVQESETYQTSLLPGFLSPLARLLARADDWPRPTRKPRRKPPEGEPR